ncbi:MAG: methionyl-tRNA formyltransferase [Clostridia bacterium]|nr:methionyl-tRNA formyltransferase [Clostridia bacterium]
MNIVFFGTGEFSATVAEAILNSEHKILAVVTQPDKVNSRGNKVTFNALKRFALDNNIPVHQFAKLNLEGEDVLREYNADFFVTASYGQIIKQNILDLPKYCIANVHGSLLPKYRGPAPIQWAIINGEKITGVTIMKTELGVDCGEMYLKKELEILPTDTSDSVFSKLSTLGGVAIVEFLDNAKCYMANGVKQDETEMSYFPMLSKEMAHIDFNKSSEQLVNLIRGQYSCNTMYFNFNGSRYKVGFARVVDGKGVAGQVLEASAKKGLVVATADGAIEIVTIQPEGKPEMSAKAFCNGGKIKVGDVL